MNKPLIARVLEAATHLPVVWLMTVLWLCVVGSIYVYQSLHGVSLLDTLSAFFAFLSTNPWAPLIYIVIYILQPFAFLPSTIFTLLAGSVFGFWPGFVYTLIGANLSAVAVYATGRLLGKPLPELTSRFARWVTPLRTKPFETILFMRLAYFPFDVVNLFSGLLKLRFTPFIIATVIGTLPGIATLTSLGTSVSLGEFLTHGISIQALNLTSLLYSIVLFIVSVAIAQLVYAWRLRQDTAPNPKQ